MNYDVHQGADIDAVDVTPVIKPIREPRLVVQTNDDDDMVDDG